MPAGEFVYKILLVDDDPAEIRFWSFAQHGSFARALYRHRPKGWNREVRPTRIFSPTGASRNPYNGAAIGTRPRNRC